MACSKSVFCGKTWKKKKILFFDVCRVIVDEPIKDLPTQPNRCNWRPGCSITSKMQPSRERESFPLIQKGSDNPTSTTECLTVVSNWNIGQFWTVNVASRKPWSRLPRREAACNTSNKTSSHYGYRHKATQTWRRAEQARIRHLIHCTHFFVCRM